MRRDARAYLWDVREAISAICSFTGGKTRAEYEDDLLVRSAVERQFEVIGEAMSQLAQLDPELSGKIPSLGQIVAFRNILIHGYALVDNDLVWRVIGEDLPELAEVIERLIAEVSK